ncbi:acetyl-CoA carboxylase biotin carboxyl carrier protein [Aurantiacibacter suaedae]|uniref:acetyl-CoA carboxylase biotin carboxyl carrier protein n=1 Tax=Aurantiacibacter suaedae TaxID=2545755 RepID=UPI001F4FD37C|nr:acetyl-CoA carboxylase biotin carboxyl carrier protein [Aurantiacibacter suaedae]
MADSKPASGRKSGMTVDTALVRELAELLAETGLTEIEVEEGDRRIRLSREMIAAPAAAISVPAPAAAAPAATPAPAAAPAAPAPSDNANAVKSPMVGTAYMASEPNSPPFIAVGDKVKAGDTLLIVEAMKVMNPITAPKDGTIGEILVDNAEPVEFDQPLVILN